MKSEIFWFVRLGLEGRQFTREQAWAVRRKLGEEVELLDFAQSMIDDGMVADVDALQRTAELALEKALDGLPPVNPFRPAAVGPPPSPATPTPPAASPAPQAAGPRPQIAAPAAGSPSPSPLPPPPRPVVETASDDPVSAAKIREFLKKAVSENASDLHLSAGARPFLRKSRQLIHLGDKPLTEAEALALNTALLTKEQRRIFLERKDFDYALALDGTTRYRVNLMFQRNGASGAYRLVPTHIPKLDELGLRNLDTIKKLLSYHNGLILVTGPVGAGKTTTLAALVNELNTTRDDHIITVEDPIELVQVSQGCNVTQREVGTHTRTFHSALKASLREDPDVIVIGELRDLETIEMAVTASETGHLVIGTMHTSDAATTLNRLLDVFPPAQQSQIRSSVAESLRGIICQRLLPGSSGGLVMACEILVSNIATANLIRDGKTQLLRNVIETGVREGMCLMETSVMDLLRDRKISPETARLNIANRQLRAKI